MRKYYISSGYFFKWERKCQCAYSRSRISLKGQHKENLSPFFLFSLVLYLLEIINFNAIFTCYKIQIFLWVAKAKGETNPAQKAQWWEQYSFKFNSIAVPSELSRLPQNHWEAVSSSGLFSRLCSDRHCRLSRDPLGHVREKMFSLSTSDHWDSSLSMVYSATLWFTWLNPLTPSSVEDI